MKDYGRRPEMTFQGRDNSGDSYIAQMTTVTQKEVHDKQVEKHSMFEKPYRSDSYTEMQNFQPSMFRMIPPWPDSISPSIRPLGGENAPRPCDGAVLQAQSDKLGSAGGYTKFRLHMGGHKGDGTLWTDKDVVWSVVFPALNPGILIAGNIAYVPLCLSSSSIKGTTAECGWSTTIVTADCDKNKCPVPISISGPSNATIGSCYTVINGTKPYTWSISQGTISSAGCITSLGSCQSANIIISVTDFNGCTANKSVTAPTGTITISGPDAPVDGNCYTASGGTAPYTWAITKGSINSSGCVTVSGQCGIATVTATDANGCQGSKQVRMPNGVWTLLSNCNTGNFCPTCGDQSILHTSYQGVYRYDWKWCCSDNIGADCSHVRDCCPSTGFDPVAAGFPCGASCSSLGACGGQWYGSINYVDKYTWSCA